MLTGRKPIVVVGSINLDLVTNAKRIPAAGETVPGHGFEVHPGGKGANQAVAIARLGYPVHMVGKVGSDIFGEQLLANLQASGVGLPAVEKTEGYSGTAVIVVGPDGENCIIVTPGANAGVSPDYVDLYLDLIRSAGLVLTQLEIPMETVAHLADVCENEGIPLMLDPAPAQVLPQGLFKRIQWFTPNETEAAFYAHRQGDAVIKAHPTLTVGLLREQGASGVILKMGSRGAHLAAEGAEEQVNAPIVEAVDTTAAGDALNGAFAVGLMSGMAPIESLRFAVAAASLSATRAGAQTAMPTLAEVTRMLKGGTMRAIEGPDRASFGRSDVAVSRHH